MVQIQWVKLIYKETINKYDEVLNKTIVKRIEGVVSYELVCKFPLIIQFIQI